MTLFALLHGGLHRGSCWDLVGNDLRERGHQTVQPDIPVDDEGAGAREWAACAIDAINTATRDVDSDVVVVGHSISGLCVPVVAANRPLRRMVFVAALIPTPRRSFADYLAENPDAINFSSFGTTTSGEGGPFGLTWESVREGFYHDCPEHLARGAFEELRGQAFTAFTEECPLDQWPNTPSSYVLMADDRTLRPEWARRAAAGLPLAQMHTLRGGHSPFFAQPTALSELLITCLDDPQ